MIWGKDAGLPRRAVVAAVEACPDARGGVLVPPAPCGNSAQRLDLPPGTVVQTIRPYID